MNKKVSVVFVGAGILCVISILLSLSLGAAQLSSYELWNALCNGPLDTAGYIFWYVRLPRTAASLLAGAALSVSGAVIQTVLNNKLASPGIIGVNAGAGVAVTLCCALEFLSGWAISISAFLGAMVSVLVVVYVSKRTGASRTTVILGGVAVNSFLNAFSEAIVTLIPEVSALRGDFRVGGFSSVSYTRLIPAAVLIFASLIIIFTMCNELDILALGEDIATSLGVPASRMRTVFLILAAMLSGAAVSFAGLLGFVGLIVPHAMRRFVGNENRYLLPSCALGGAGFVTICDLVARLLFVPFELPVGILMSMFGGPFFLLLLMKQKGGHTDVGGK